MEPFRKRGFLFLFFGVNLSMIPPELISMGFGAASGFLFKYMAQRAKERADLFKERMAAHEAKEKSHDAAAERVSIDGGKVVRRIIVISILFGVIIAPFFLALVDEPLYMQITETKPSFLFGLFGGGTENYFVRLDGFPMIPEVRQTLTAIVGFYFGSSAAKS